MPGKPPTGPRTTGRHAPGARSHRRLRACRGARGRVVWTGDAMLVWASNSPDGPAGGAVYDPGSDTWRRLPAGPLGSREGYSSVWTGKELLVIGGALGDTLATPIAAAVNPRTGTWRLVPAFDDFVFFGGPNGAVWDGHEAFVAGTLSLCPERSSACAERRPVLVAYNPATDTVREITLPAPSEAFGADTAVSLKPIGWTGTEVVFSADGSGSVRVIRYNPTIDGWKGVPAAVASCGEFGLQIYSLATNTWTLRTMTPGPSPLSSRGGSAIVWTGTDLIVWSGMVGKPGNPTPADGASLTLKNLARPER